MRYFVFLLIFLTSCTSDQPSRQQVVIGLGEDIEMINPLLSRTAYARQIEELIYLPLFQFDPIDLDLKPVLATRRAEVEEINDGRIKYSFQIRPEAKWSDGQSVTAADYAFTFKLIYNKALNTHGYRAYLSFLDEIVLDDEDEKKIEVIANKAYHLAETVLGNIEIFPKHIHDPNGLLDTKSIADLRSMSTPDSSLIKLAEDFRNYGQEGTKSIIGSGPYELENWIEEESILLKKKTDYWGNKIKDAPVQLSASADYLKYNFIRDRLVAFQELKAAGIDIMNQIPLSNMKEVLERNFSNLAGMTADQFTHYYIALNPQKKGLENPELRKALNHCFDIEEWIEHQMYGMAVPVTNPISPLKDYYHHDLPITYFDPKVAIDIFRKYGFNELNEAGIRYRKKGDVIEKLSFELIYSIKNESAASLALFFKEKAKLSGVEIIPKPQDFSSLRKAYGQGDFDMVFLASSVPPADYDPQQNWHTKSWGKGNRVRFGNSESDELIDKICRSLDPNERAGFYKGFQKEIYEEQPCLFLYSPKQRVAFKKDLKVTSSKLWPGYITQLLQ